jgi:2-keto-4-pentenoate hydratase/2-oxohepta-3-ene-1,7-dioic acid hydratase in catechol pathway
VNVYGLAYNYKGYDHDPIFFMKGNVTEALDPIPVPNVLTWPEPELGFILGNGRIKTFLLANDVTSQIKDWDCHLPMSKARDGYCPVIPIYPSSPSDVTLKAFVNDVEVVKGHTGSRKFMEAGAIGFIEHYLKLYPGDIVLTGCPPHSKAPMKRGDWVRVEAWEKGHILGTLENPVV